MIKKKIFAKRIYKNPEVFYGVGSSSILKSLEQNKILVLISKTVHNSEYYKKFIDFLQNKVINSEGQVSIASTTLLTEIGNSCIDLLKNGFDQLERDNQDIKGLADILYSGYLGGIINGNAYVGVVHALAHS